LRVSSISCLTKKRRPKAACLAGMKIELVMATMAAAAVAA
jgi:hypothetical protein